MGLFDRFFGPPSREKFGKMFIKGIQRAGEKRKVTYDPKQSYIVVANTDKAPARSSAEFGSWRTASRRSRIRLSTSLTRNPT
jgi:hypothetical protein